MIALTRKGRRAVFAIRPLTGHLIRGAIASGLLCGAIRLQIAHPAGSIVTGLGALVALRGCPACWTIALVEMLRQRLRTRTAGPATEREPPTSDSIQEAP